jgi:Fe2+ or Zn2+ uptake regulation protein
VSKAFPDIKRPVGPDTKVYMCECCGGVFDAEPDSYEKAEEGLKKNEEVMKDDMDEGMAVVCSDCWEQICSFMESQGKTIVR